uniref:Uncharacterized protein n=1 Tax=Romanomermis culicivorax TaxID=13658 RepID=A0A915K491_ROMCU
MRRTRSGRRQLHGKIAINSVIQLEKSTLRIILLSLKNCKSEVEKSENYFCDAFKFSSKSALCLKHDAKGDVQKNSGIES